MTKENRNMRSDHWHHRFIRTSTSAALVLAVAVSAPAFGQNAAPSVSPAAESVQKTEDVKKADPQRVRELISSTRSAAAAAGQEKPMPTEQVVNPNEAPVIVFDPPIADMGDMAAEVAKTVTIQIKNVHSEPIRISKAIPGCGCTTPVWPKDPIPPGGSAPCEITLKPGATQGIKLSKKVTFQIENHNPVVLSVEGNVVAYVVMTPAMLESPSEDGSTTAPGIISLESADGTAFKITEVSPPVIKDLNTESKLRHTLTVDWANWESAGRSPKISIKTDHPKSPALTMLVKRSMVGKNAPTAPDANKPVAGPGTTDLVNAVRSGDLAKVSSVIASGADVNERDRAGQKTAMHWAAKTGNRAAMEALVAAKADPNVKDRQGRTPLWSGVETDVEVVKFLVDKGADVNARDLIKSTPLLWASGFGKPETVAFLLSKGADVKATDDNGWTPLIWAAGLGQPMTVDILVKSGADLTVADQTAGDTALLRAARTGKPESLKILIAAGADVSVKNKAGQTALHLAAASGNVEKVQQLLAAKADPAAVDAKGWAPIDHAMNRTAGDKTKLLEVLRPVSPAPQAANPAPAGDAAAAPKQ
jgi:ankyrin repeat protein